MKIFSTLEPSITILGIRTRVLFYDLIGDVIKEIQCMKIILCICFVIFFSCICSDIYKITSVIFSLTICC